MWGKLILAATALAVAADGAAKPAFLQACEDDGDAGCAAKLATAAAGDDVATVAARAGLKTPKSDPAKRRRRPPKTDANHHDLLPDLANVSWADVRAVSPFVHDRASRLARAHGYDV